MVFYHELLKFLIIRDIYKHHTIITHIMFGIIHVFFRIDMITRDVVSHKKLEKEKEKLAALEKQHGVTGFAELQSRLEEVSGKRHGHFFYSSTITSILNPLKRSKAEERSRKRPNDGRYFTDGD